MNLFRYLVCKDARDMISVVKTKVAASNNTGLRAIIYIAKFQCIVSFVIITCRSIQLRPMINAQNTRYEINRII